MHNQKGLTFWSVVFSIGPIIIVALLTLRLFPAYAEYFTIKKAFANLNNGAALSTMSDIEIQAAMDRTTSIDSITSITSKDLKIKRLETKTIVSVEYEVVVPLVGNVSALLSFSASTDQGRAAVSAAPN
jgi:hypothetical protein